MSRLLIIVFLLTIFTPLAIAGKVTFVNKTWFNIALIDHYLPQQTTIQPDALTHPTPSHLPQGLAGTTSASIASSPSGVTGVSFSVGVLPPLH
jgi:hypothetical protein